MHYYNKFAIIIIVAFSISYCKTKDKKEYEEWEVEYKNGKILDSLNLIKGIKLAASYGALSDWPHYQYTYQFQEAMKANNNIFAFEASINDIVKKDSTYLLHLGLNYKGIAEIETIPRLFEKLDTLYRFEVTLTGYFIVRVTNISTIFPLLISRVNENDPDIDDSFNFDDENKHYLKINGVLIDFIMFKKVEKDNVVNIVRHLIDEKDTAK
jgi:hypothetical protein